MRAVPSGVLELDCRRQTGPREAGRMRHQDQPEHSRCRPNLEPTAEAEFQCAQSAQTVRQVLNRDNPRQRVRAGLDFARQRRGEHQAELPRLRRAKRHVGHKPDEHRRDAVRVRVRRFGQTRNDHLRKSGRGPHVRVLDSRDEEPQRGKADAGHVRSPAHQGARGSPE